MDYLVGLALLPAIILMIYIYKMDKREKEPFRKLLLCFFWGIISVIPAIIIEEVCCEILNEAFTSSIAYLLVENFLIVALTEEGCKYFFLNKISKKNAYYDYFFDGIVYSVFVSLGFAATENVMYVLQNGIGTAILRMFTAVPGHTCFAIFMGYYYSRKRYCDLFGDKKGAKKYAKLAIWVPVLIHGAYDFFASMGGGLSVLIWLVGLILMFIFSFKLVNRASREDCSLDPYEPAYYPQDATTQPMASQMAPQMISQMDQTMEPTMTLPLGQPQQFVNPGPDGVDNADGMNGEQ